MGLPTSQGGAERSADSVNSVLVVDDEILLRLFIADELRERGYAVMEAANAQEALSVLESGAAVDVVFTDVHMPGPINGVELARIIRATWPEVDVIVTSGSEVCIDDQRAAALFVRKPYDSAAVIEQIGLLIGARRRSPPSQAASVA